MQVVVCVNNDKKEFFTENQLVIEELKCSIIEKSDENTKSCIKEVNDEWITKILDIFSKNYWTYYRVNI